SVQLLGEMNSTALSELRPSRLFAAKRACIMIPGTEPGPLVPVLDSVMTRRIVDWKVRTA
ncbi:MAG TPA: hypothetical protein PLP42_18010, partial [Acidobacteriota bacterium]|nr:hypothetical protein [Acidobacteriota bacterium]